VNGIPLVVRDDAVAERPDWHFPMFLPGTEQPRLEPGEELLATVPNCGIALGNRACDQARWEPTWRAPTAGTATFTDRRLVVGCRPYPPAAAQADTDPAAAPRPPHPQTGKCLGVHLRYEWVAHITIQLATAARPSDLIVVSRSCGGQWRLTVSSLDLTTEGAPLAEAVAAAAARRQLGNPAARDPAVAAELRAQTQGVRLRPAPGTAATAWLPGAHPTTLP
jgi:hypothetical protein